MEMRYLLAGVLDLNRALLYGNMDGYWREAGQAKNYLTIVDGIVIGEGNGPMPRPRKIQCSAFYPHKNLDLIPHVAAIHLKRLKGLRPVFYFSFQEDSSGWRRIREKAHRHGNIDSVRTVGKVNPSHTSSFYSEADAMLLPSVLESFSANYPEAMISGVPIVTTDFPFARDICGKASLYFRPMDPFYAAGKINTLIDNQGLADLLKEKGFERVRSFPTPEEKAKLYLEACRPAWQNSLA